MKRTLHFRLLLFAVDGDESLHEGADLFEFTEFAAFIGCTSAGTQSAFCIVHRSRYVVADPISA